jgi:hypothetical protein
MLETPRLGMQSSTDRCFWFVAKSESVHTEKWRQDYSTGVSETLWLHHNNKRLSRGWNQCLCDRKAMVWHLTAIWLRFCSDLPPMASNVCQSMPILSIVCHIVKQSIADQYRPLQTTAIHCNPGANSVRRPALKSTGVMSSWTPVHAIHAILTYIYA